MTVMEASGDLGTASNADFSMVSTTESADTLQALLAPEPEKTTDTELSPEDEVKKAAATLGKEGGKAAAEKRALDREAKAAETAEAEIPEEKLGKPRNDARARMLEATREAAELKRELAAERAAHQRLQSERPGRAEEKTEPKRDVRPEEKDFDNYADFVEARSRWAARQEYAQVRQVERVHAQAAAYADGVTRTVNSFTERVDKIKAADPGFMERVSQDVWDSLQPSFQLGPNDEPTAYHVMADEVLASEQAPEVLIYLSEHPDQFQRIASLKTPRDVSREMAKIEARLEAATASTSSRPSVSKAKPPVRLVTGSPATATVEPSDESSFDDHYKFYQAKRRAR